MKVKQNKNIENNDRIIICIDILFLSLFFMSLFLSQSNALYCVKLFNGCNSIRIVEDLGLGNNISEYLCFIPCIDPIMEIISIVSITEYCKDISLSLPSAQVVTLYTDILDYLYNSINLSISSSTFYFDVILLDIVDYFKFKCINTDSVFSVLILNKIMNNIYKYCILMLIRLLLFVLSFILGIKALLDIRMRLVK